MVDAGPDHHLAGDTLLCPLGGEDLALAQEFLAFVAAGGDDHRCRGCRGGGGQPDGGIPRYLFGSEAEGFLHEGQADGFQVIDAADRASALDQVRGKAASEGGPFGGHHHRRQMAAGGMPGDENPLLVAAEGIGVAVGPGDGGAALAH